jgi:transcriptional regulator with XRE-family HTH domain
MKKIRKADWPKDPFITSMSDVGLAIKAARTQANLRMVDTAMLVGVSIQTLVDIEAGRPGVSFGKVLQVANSLGVSFFVLPARKRNLLRNLIEREPLMSY